KLTAARPAGGTPGRRAGRVRTPRCGVAAALAFAFALSAALPSFAQQRGSGQPAEVDAQTRGTTAERASKPASQSDGGDWPYTSTTDEFVVANAQFVLMHELAHLVIEEKRVPILGPEESAADYIAAMMLIRPRTVPPEGPDALLRVAVNTADGFALDRKSTRLNSSHVK